MSTQLSGKYQLSQFHVETERPPRSMLTWIVLAMAASARTRSRALMTIRDALLRGRRNGRASKSVALLRQLLPEGRSMVAKGSSKVQMRLTRTEGEPKASSHESTGRSYESMADSAMLGPSVDSMVGMRPRLAVEEASN